jgi:hypothetical protein
MSHPAHVIRSSTDVTHTYRYIRKEREKRKKMGERQKGMKRGNCQRTNGNRHITPAKDID